MDQALLHLAEAAGIAPQFWDINGAAHPAPEKTIRAILRAMGFDPDHPEAALRDLAARWARLAAPVYILYTADPKAVALKLPQAAEGALSWLLTEEGGKRHQGGCDAGDLPVGSCRAGFGAEGAAGICEHWLTLPDLPMGYHKIALSYGGESYCAALIVSPGQGYVCEKARCTGVAAQLYALRGAEESAAEKWGIGDFSALDTLLRAVAAAGGDAVGLNPLHALFPDQPAEASPYCPASRLFKNPLYLDLPVPADFVPAAGDCVDYPAVAAGKFRVLRRMYLEFCQDKHSDAFAGFTRFSRAGGVDLQRFTAFQAFSEKFGTHDWQRWDGSLHDPGSDASAALMRELAPQMAFFSWLQFLCEQQHASAARAARGMAIGLYNDLAVSVNAASADCWSHQEIFAKDLRIGAPPDPFNMAGQEWGVVPMLPGALSDSGYSYFIALLRANMRHAGALRIDHVMGWLRLFLLPAGGSPADGAYVAYPANDLFAIATLESQRNRCMLIGEDLGTVPDGFRERMAATHMLSCKVFWFERDGARPVPPENYIERAAASVATHDLPTLKGWLSRVDVADKVRAGLIKDDAGVAQADKDRDGEMIALLWALGEAGLLPEGLDPADPKPEVTDALADAVAAYVARAPSKLLLVQMDDLAGQIHQTNMPGTTVSYPNWSYRLPEADLHAAMTKLAAICARRDRRR